MPCRRHHPVFSARTAARIGRYLCLGCIYNASYNTARVDFYDAQRKRDDEAGAREGIVMLFAACAVKSDLLRWIFSEFAGGNEELCGWEMEDFLWFPGSLSYGCV